MARITCKGIEGMAKRLQAMGKNVEPACQAAVYAGGKLLVKELKAACPENTGTLKKSIKAEKPVTGFGTGTTCLVHPTGEQHGERNGAIAFYVEYGTGSGNRKKPHPWWFPTIERARPMVEAEVKRTFLEEMKKV